LTSEDELQKMNCFKKLKISTIFEGKNEAHAQGTPGTAYEII
jgi:hypothetical protein